MMPAIRPPQITHDEPTSCDMGYSLHAGAGQLADVLEEMHERAHQLLPVALVQALVRGVGVAERVLNAEEQGRGAAEQIGQRADEADAAAAADADSVTAVAAAQGGHRCLERRAIRVG